MNAAKFWWKACLLVSIISIGILGCTRDIEPSNNISVSFSSEAVSSQSSEILMHAVINVRDSGNKIVFSEIWDHPCEGGNNNATQCPQNAPPPAVAPPVYTIKVEEGETYLVQVLGVYVDVSTGQEGSLIFKYDDDQKTINQQVETADITLEAIGQTSSGEVRVGGRFLTSANSGPTDNILLTYQPPDDKPEMQIIEDIMLNGWFNFFALPGANFNYRRKSNGQALFEALDPSAGASSDVADTPYRARFSVPNSFRDDDGMPELQEGGEAVIGFYGPYVESNPASFRLCFEDIDQDPLNDLYQTSALSSPLTFDSQSPFAAGSIHPIGTGGGQGISCVTGSEPNKIIHDYRGFDGWLGSFFGFESAYKYTNDGSGRFRPIRVTDGQISGNSTQLTVAWSYLHGVIGSGGISGSEIYLVGAGLEEEYRGNEYWMCEKLAQDSRVFTSVSNMSDVTFFPATIDSPTNGEGDITFPTAWLSQNNNNDGPEAIVCPYRSINSQKSYLNAGVKLGGLGFNFPQNKLDVILAGSGVNGEAFYQNQKGLGGQNYSFLNMNFNGGTQPVKMIPFASQISPPPGMPAYKQYIDISDVSDVEVSVNGGGFLSITSCSGVIDNPNLNGTMAIRVDMNQLAVCAVVSTAWASGTQSADVQFRITIDPAQADSYGLGGGSGNVLTTGIWALKADSTCSGAALEMANHSAPTTIVTNANFMTEFFGSNGTDLRSEYFPTYSSSSTICTDAVNGNRPISVVVNHSILISNPGCFQYDPDIEFGKPGPFSFSIDPKDTTGADCNLGSTVFQLNTAGSNDIFAKVFASDVIEHSIVPAKMVHFMGNESNPTTLGTWKLMFDSFFTTAGSATVLSLISVFANSDGQITDPLVSTSFPSNLDFGTGPLETGIRGNAPNIILDDAAPPGQYVLRPTAVSTGEEGNIEVIYNDMDVLETIVYMGDKSFRGGSPIFVTNRNSQAAIYYIPDGESRLELIAENLGNVVERTMSVDHYYPGSGDYDYIVLSAGSEMVFVAYHNNDGVASVDTRTFNSNALVWDLRVEWDGNNDFILAVTHDGASDGRIMYVPFSTYDGSTWTHPAPLANVQSETDGRILNCGGSWYLMGIWNANYAGLIPFNIVDDGITHTFGTYSWGDAIGDYYGEYDGFACSQYGGEDHFFTWRHNASAQAPSAGRIPLIFKGYQEGTTTSFNEDLFVDAGRTFQTATYFDIDLDGQDELIVIWRPGGTYHTVEVYEHGAGGTAYTVGDVIGRISSGAYRLRGMRFIQQGSETYLYVYGTRGRVYKMKVRI